MARYCFGLLYDRFKLSRKSVDVYSSEKFLGARLVKLVDLNPRKFAGDDRLKKTYDVYCVFKQKDLAAAMGVRVTELSKGIEKLQDNGFVAWKTDREAGRTYVELSSKAVELMAEEQALLQRCYRRMRAELGDEELRRAAATMQRATAILKEEREKEFPAGQ